jgi:hypothetical protein
MGGKKSVVIPLLGHHSICNSRIIGFFQTDQHWGNSFG